MTPHSPSQAAEQYAKDKIQAAILMTIRDMTNWPVEAIKNLAEKMFPQLLSNAFLAGYKLAHEWIKVTPETMPEENTRVLIIEDSGYIEICYYGKRDGKGKLIFMDEQDEHPSICCPTHWQPLPTPPEAIK